MALFSHTHILTKYHEILAYRYNDHLYCHRWHYFHTHTYLLSTMKSWLTSTMAINIVTGGIIFTHTHILTKYHEILAYKYNGHQYCHRSHYFHKHIYLLSTMKSWLTSTMAINIVTGGIIFTHTWMDTV